MFAVVWSSQGVGYGQSLVENGRVYWTDVRRGIYRSSLDGANVEHLVQPDWRRPHQIALDVAGGKMYWAASNILFRSDLDGANVEAFASSVEEWTIEEAVVYAAVYATGLAPICTGMALDLSAGKIYWTMLYDHWDYHTSEVLRANLDGTEIEFTQPEHLDGINSEILLELRHFDYSENLGTALDPEEGRIYWIDSEGAIQRSDLDSTNVEVILEAAGATDIALDLAGGRIYWTGSRGTIHRSDLDGANIEDLFSPMVRAPYGLALDVAAKKMYWTDLVAGTILRSDLNGSMPEILVTELDMPKGLALYPSRKFYWADSGTGKIQAANLNGSNVEDIVTGLDGPDGIAVDLVSSKLYWKEELGTIHRSNLDGTNVEHLITEPNWNPSGLTLDVVASKMYWTHPLPGTGRVEIRRSDLDGSNVETIVPPGGWGNYDTIAIDPALSSPINELDWALTDNYDTIAIDPVRNKIIWGNLGFGSLVGFGYSPNWLEILQADLDGANVKEIYFRYFGEVPSTAPTGMALDFYQAGTHPDSIPTAVATHSPSVERPTFGLETNVPNPFNATTQIAYRLAAPGLVRLEIYNTLGQSVHTLVNKVQPTGRYQVRWDARAQQGTPLAAGVYIVSLHHPDGVRTRRLLYLK